MITEILKLQKKFELVDGEDQISIFNSVQSFNGFLPKNCAGYLTNYRIAFVKLPSLMWVSLGPIGAGIASALISQYIDFQIIFSEIDRIDKGCYGLTKMPLFKMKDGNEYKLAFTNSQKNELKNLNILLPD
ncbi:MAG: hypothetical protein IBX46_11380 [Desulfuromonadales bacterium]|nr:hypothetical protein [Desulfuromonadales bacterium]